MFLEKSSSKSSDVEVTEKPLCEICQINPSKYCCPNEACSKLTCSLTCCKQHKVETGCNGKRDLTAFKPLSSYEAKDLQSDYHLLENISLGVDRAKRSRSRDVANGNKWNVPNERNAKRRMAVEEAEESMFPSTSLDIAPLSKNHMSGSSKKLLNVAHKQSIQLQMMPVGMSRHERNTTQVVGDSIQWLIQFEFNIPNQPCHVLLAERIDQNRCWLEVLKTLVNDQSSAELRHILRRYVEILNQSGDDYLNIAVLLKQEPCPANSISYYQLDPTSSILTCLSKKTIIEFPVVKVALTQELNEFNTISPLIIPIQTNDSQ